MSILIDGRYIQDHFPGIGRYTYNLIDALARTSPADSFAVLHNPALRNTRYDITALLRYPNVELLPSNVPTFSIREQVLLHGTIHSKRNKAEVVHSPYYIKPYFNRIPSVVTLFDLLPIRYSNAVPSRRARLFFRLAVQLAVATATAVIAPSTATRDDLIEILQVPSHKITIIPLAADTRFRPQPRSELERVREKYALPPRYVLYVGINKPHKNLDALVRAWQKVGRRGCGLVIAGAWDSRYGIESQGNGAEVRFIHGVADADLPALYAGAAVFVMPSFYEGFGLPPLEAMACGAPVVCSNTSSLPEVVGDAAVLFDPRDVDEIAVAIERVLSDPGLCEEMAAKSLARAAQFTWERTARETLKVYQAAKCALGSTKSAPESESWPH